MRCRNVVDGASRPEDRGPADRVRVSQSTPRRNDAGLLEHTSIMNSLTPSACQDVQKQATDHVQKLWSEYERQAENLRRDANGTSEAAASTRFEVSFKATAGPYNSNEWKLSLQKDQSIPIGRSGAKKFKESGISLKKDDSVSTSHAKVGRPFRAGWVLAPVTYPITSLPRRWS